MFGALNFGFVHYSYSEGWVGVVGSIIGLELGSIIVGLGVGYIMGL